MNMKYGAIRVVLALTLVAWSAMPAFAQASATSVISGVVTDTGGGVIPGATVVVANDAGAKYEVISNAQGAFSIPALSAGAYKVSVSLSGFKTWTTEVRVAPGTNPNLKAVLEIGAITEEVVVRTNSEILNTQTATVSSTLDANQINRMPTPTRNALNAVTFLPGVNTAGVNRNSTVNGLPESMINITLDGVGNNDNFNKSTDGFFASVTPRQDAIEAVTVTTAVAGVNQGGSGGVTIAMQTRSGTNQFSGSGYEYFRHPNLNTNSWSNTRNDLPKNEIKLNQFGGRVGGPIVMPGLYDGRGKAFFFFHYEQLRLPRTDTRTRTIFKDDVLGGWVNYQSSTLGTQRVNVLDVAARTGNLTTVDPLMIGVLNRIQAATTSSGIGVINTTNSLITNEYVWQAPGRLFEQQPTARVDYNLGPNHRLSGSVSSLFTFRDPDYLNDTEPRFPGAPNYRVFKSTRPLYSTTLRSTLSGNMVNELRGGLTAVGGAGSRFGQPDDPSLSVNSFADTDLMAIAIPTITDWHTSTSPSWRAAPTYNIDETVNWQLGNHSFNFGGSFLRSSAWENAQTMVPTMGVGFSSANDPANGMFTTANFPGASGGQLNTAREIYAILTGRLTSVGGQAALDPATNRYVAFGPRRREGRIDVYSAFAQDSWRMKPTVTINYGVRWDLQQPFTALNDTMSAVTLESACGMSGLGDGGTYSKCAFFSRNNTGVVPEFIQYGGGTKGYTTDWNNFSPSIGVAWRPNVQSGFMRTLLGDPEAATVRAGFSRSFERQGIGFFTGQFGSNPGSTITLTRNAASGNLVLPGEQWPVLLSQRERLGPASFAETPTFPFALRSGRQDSLNLFAPDIEVASAASWNLSFQRSITRDMAAEIRYVGTRGLDQWSELNYNERDILNNGFYDEFKLAVANLQANNVAGGNRLGSFAYFGAGTGTSPLPTYLAYLNGRTNAGDPAAYTGGNWASTALTNDMVFINQLPRNSAADLDGDAARRTNALAAGLPANFFVLNPVASGVNVIDSGAYSDYHALQMELRRRLSRGLSANVSYQYAIEGGSAFLGFMYGRVMNPSANVRHAIKTQWDWTIPVGRGQRFGTDMHPVLDTLLGGWSFNGVGRIQAVMVNFGNVRLVGMTQDDLQSMFKHERKVDEDGVPFVQMLPDDVILNTRRALSFSSTTADGYSESLGAPEGRYFAPANSATCTQLKSGDCAPRTLLVRAPWFTRFDIGMAKRIPLQGRTNLEVRFELLNIFDNINFNNSDDDDIDDGEDIFRVTGHYTDFDNTFDPGGRLGQFMIRINW